MRELLSRFGLQINNSSTEYGRSLVRQQLEEGRWWSGPELRERINGVVSNRVSQQRIYPSYIEALISYKLGALWPDLEDPSNIQNLQ